MNDKELLNYYEHQIRALELEKTALRKGIYDMIVNHKSTPAEECNLPDSEDMEMFAEMLKNIDSKLEYNRNQYDATLKNLKMSTETFKGDGYNA